MNEMSEVLCDRLGCEVVCLAGGGEDEEGIHAFIVNSDNRLPEILHVNRDICLCR